MDKVIVITGASTGIGAVAARKLVKLGAKVVLAARSIDKLEALHLGENALYVKADVSIKSDVTGLIEKAISHFGKVDVLWNNAGAVSLSFFEDGLTDEWDQMVDVNLKGVLYGISAVLPHMLANGSGHIVSTASVQGYKTLPATGVYAATKFAVRAIMDTLRQETAGKVKVTTLYPGLVNTAFNDNKASEKAAAMFGDMSGYPSLDPEAVADAFIYAISQPGNAVANEIILRAAEQTI
jgi:NADP-dependent 3-hydroxy acid dehydrogenase YdfG